MFNQSHKSRVAKHLAVFGKAVSGLKQVQAEIRTEEQNRLKDRKDLMDQVRVHTVEIEGLQAHHDEVGKTIEKLSALLPAK